MHVLILKWYLPRRISNMEKTYRGVQALPAFHQDFKSNSQKLFQTVDHDWPGPSQKLGSQARPSYLPPITSPAAPTVANPTLPTITYSRAPEQTQPSSFRNDASSKFNDSKSRRQSRMGAGTVILPDPRFGTDNIRSLNLYNFQNFHRGMEKSLVMFYTTPGPDKDRLTHEFETAADRTQVDGYGFGAVDCFMDDKLCCREQVCKTPMLKLYSNGFQVSAIQEPSSFTAYQMEMLMRNTPVLTQPKAQVKQQPARPGPRIIMGTRMLDR